MLTGDTPRSTDASWRQFNRYWVGQLASFTGDWFSIVAFPLAALALTDSAFYVGVVEFSELVATMLLGIWLGALADRWMPRATMIAWRCSPPSASSWGASAISMTAPRT